MEKQKARIEDWFVGHDDLLIGTVYGHPKLRDGSEVVTSRVVKWDSETKTAVTLNTEYTLGEPRKPGYLSKDQKHS